MCFIDGAGMMTTDMKNVKRSRVTTEGATSTLIPGYGGGRYLLFGTIMLVIVYKLMVACSKSAYLQEYMIASFKSGMITDVQQREAKISHQDKKSRYQAEYVSFMLLLLFYLSDCISTHSIIQSLIISLFISEPQHLPWADFSSNLIRQPNAYS